MNPKIPILLLLTLLLIPLSFAQEEEKCGITNIASCISQKFYEYTLSIINAPLQPFLTLSKSMLTEPVNTTLFFSIWAIIIYIISLFYGLFILWAGFNFIISGYDADKRERAKSWLKNVILMVFFVQASYYIYGLLLELVASMSAGVINMIDPDFFLLTMDNIVNLGLSIALSAVYMLVLLVYVIIMGVRYLLISAGVIFFPIGIFLYFIDPLKNYGKYIINLLIVLMLVPFIHAIILLAASKIIELPLFAALKILVMIIAFLLCIITLFVASDFVKSNSSGPSVISRGAKALQGQLFQ